MEQCPFTVGQRVICVDDRPTMLMDPSFLLEGQEYTIEEILPWLWSNGGSALSGHENVTIGLRLKGVERWSGFTQRNVPLSWKRFRPAQETRTFVNAARLQEIFDFVRDPKQKVVT